MENVQISLNQIRLSFFHITLFFHVFPRNLTFENSLCIDYVTEKYWRNSLERGLVPVVYGASRYSLHVADFGSIKALADYLKYLDKTTRPITNMLSGKRNIRYSSTHFGCQLSAKISPICKLSVKFLAICQLSVKWLLIDLKTFLVDSFYRKKYINQMQNPYFHHHA